MKLSSIAFLAAQTSAHRLRSRDVQRVILSLVLAGFVFWWGVSIGSGLLARQQRSETRLDVLDGFVASRTFPTSAGRGTLLVHWLEGEEGPGPGTIAASPRLLHGGDLRSEYLDELPWPVSGPIADELLAYPDEEVALLTVDPTVIEPQGGEGERTNQGVSAQLPLLVMVLVTVPTAVLLWISSRVAAERRARVYAAMSTAGVLAVDLRRIAVIEGSFFGIVGSAASLLLFGISVLAGRAFTDLGAQFFLEDLVPDREWVLILLTLPVIMSVGSAILVSAREAKADLADTSPKKLSARRTAPLLLGLLLLGLSGLVANADSVGLLILVELTGLGLTLAGTLLAGPWLVQAAARLWTQTRYPRVGSYLAINMIQHDVRRSFRSVSGLAVVAMVYGFIGPLVQPLGWANIENQSADQVQLAMALRPAMAREIVLLGSQYEDAVIVPMVRRLSPGEFQLLAPCEVVQVLGVQKPCESGGTLDLDSDLSRLMAPDGYTLKLHETPVEELLAASAVSEVDVAIYFEDPSSLSSQELVRQIRLRAPIADFLSIPEHFSDDSDEREINLAIRATFMASILLSGGAVLVTTLSEIARRKQLDALFSIVGFKTNDRRRLALHMFALPVCIGIVPALAAGLAASLSLAASLGGDYAVPWSGILLALALSIALVVAAAILIAVSVRPTKASSDLIAALS